MSRQWTCRKCRTVNPRVKQRCPVCATRRPASRPPAHRAVLDDPYEVWVERFGEQCGICEKPPSPSRRLDRDHSKAGVARGLLCWSCNKKLDSRVTADWLRKAADYVDRSSTTV